MLDAYFVSAGGKATASVKVTVLPSGAPAADMRTECSTETVIPEELGQLIPMPVAIRGNVTPLCDGKVLLANLYTKMIDLVDTRWHSVLQRWTIDGLIKEFVLVPGTRMVVANFQDKIPYPITTVMYSPVMRIMVGVFPSYQASYTYDPAAGTLTHAWLRPRALRERDMHELDMRFEQHCGMAVPAPRGKVHLTAP